MTQVRRWKKHSHSSLSLYVRVCLFCALLVFQPLLTCSQFLQQTPTHTHTNTFKQSHEPGGFRCCQPCPVHETCHCPGQPLHPCPVRLLCRRRACAAGSAPHQPRGPVPH